MNTSFISDSEIDRVLGRIGEHKGDAGPDRPFDRFNMSEEDKTKLRAEYARKKAAQYAVTPGLVYSEEQEFMRQPSVSRDKNMQVFASATHSAGIIRRTYAFCTDLCIVGLALMAFVYASITFFGAEKFARATDYGWWLGMLYAVIFVLYLVYFEGTMGQTPGKMFLNVRIVDEKNQKPSFGRAFMRTLLFFVPPVGLLGVHNFLTKTRLVNIG
jgi:uncharacterized RDD family membrane protein YckC